MFYCKIIFTVVLFIQFQAFLSCPDGYYWREYTGIIPDDAVVGGKDINDKNIYIGQAYVHNIGLIVASISPGIKEVQFHIAYKPYTIRYNIKILCGPQQNFYWEAVNTTNFHLFLTDMNAVIGGHVSGGTLNIGRVNLDGDTKIGRIHSYELLTPDLDVTHKGSEKLITQFEILLYGNRGIDERTSL